MINITPLFKKIFFLLVIILTSTFIVFYFLTNKDEAQNTELSNRSLEFIRSQKSDQNSMWKDFDADNKVDNSPTEKLIKSDCFEFTLNAKIYNIKNENTQNKCVLRLGTNQPKGLLTISLETLANLQKLDDYSAIKLRVTQPETYQLIENKNELKKFQSEKEITYFYLIKDKLLIISLYDLVQVTQTTVELMDKILLSVVIK
jgi:hypothetical protein